MLPGYKQNNAIRVSQQLVIYARKMAYENVSQKDIAKLLDDIEYLLGLISEDEDSTEKFRKYVEGVAADYGISIILDIFNS